MQNSTFPLLLPTAPDLFRYDAESVELSSECREFE